MLAAALSQVLGALWAFVLDMVACLTGRCAHAPLKSELPIVAPPYEDRVSRQVHHKAAAVSTHAYGATSLAWRNNGFGAFFDDSGEELDVKEFGARIDDTEDMKSEWSKLLKQGSDSKTFEDGVQLTLAHLECHADDDLARRSLLFLAINNEESVAGARSISRCSLFFTPGRTRLGRHQPRGHLLLFLAFYR